VRTRSIVVLVVGLLALVSGGAALLDHLGKTRVPSPELCAAQWNAPTNRRSRAIESAAHFDVAVVSGWLAKERFPGCGVLFRGDEGEPWLWYAGSLHEGRVRVWDRVSGEGWGEDSPEGGPDGPNAVVTVEGRVRLDEP
jgi:hypothetical protein